MRRIAVAGGGIAGLAAALYLRDAADQRGLALQISLYEPQRLGGCIETWREDGFIMEAGPDSLLAAKPAAMRMLDRLGLRDRLVPMLPEYKGARILHHGKLRKLPAQFRLFSPLSIRAIAASGLFSPAGMVRAALEPLIPPRRSRDDESLASFVARRFGREVLDRLAQPLVGGIYSADPQHLSMEAALPQFSELERRSGSIIRAMASNRNAPPAPVLMSLQGGLETIVGAIRAQLDGVAIVPQAAGTLKELRAQYDGVILATPAYASASIVRDADPQLAAQLESIHYNSMATITLAYRKSDLPELPRTQGFVVPFVEHRKIVAATISSQKYPGRAPAEFVLIRAFAGGGLQPEILEKDDAELLRVAQNELRDILCVDAPAVVARVYRAIRALPEYAVGHKRLVETIEERTARLGSVAVAGCAYHGVGIPDCIASGEAAAERLLGTM